MRSVDLKFDKKNVSITQLLECCSLARACSIALAVTHRWPYGLFTMRTATRRYATLSRPYTHARGVPTTPRDAAVIGSSQFYMLNNYSSLAYWRGMTRKKTRRFVLSSSVRLERNRTRGIARRLAQCKCRFIDNAVLQLNPDGDEVLHWKPLLFSSAINYSYRNNVYRLSLLL